MSYIMDLTSYISYADIYPVVPTTEKATIVCPSGCGITIKTPQGLEGQKVYFGTCSPKNSTFPEGFVPFTVTYQLSSTAPLKKVNLSIEHNAVIETEEDAEHMTFCIAQPPSDEDEEIKFTPLPGGEFEVGGVLCNLSTSETGLLKAGSMQHPSKISKIFYISFSK